MIFMKNKVRLKPLEFDEQLQALYDKLSPEDQRLLGVYGLSVVTQITKRLFDDLVGCKNV